VGGGLQQLQMPPREDLNLPEHAPTTESATAGAGAESTSEGTEQEVPEVEMAAAPEPLVASSKMPSSEPSVSSTAKEDDVEVEVEEVTHREANTVSSEAETNSHRSSTFLTEVDEEDGGATASLADIVAAVGEVETVGSIKDVDEAAASDAKQLSPAPSKETSPAPVKETSPPPASAPAEKSASPEPQKETSPAPAKEESPAPAKETSPAPEKELSPPPPVQDTAAKEASPEVVKEASPAPAKEATPAPSTEEAPAKEASPEPVKESSPAPAKEESPAKVEEEPIGAVEDLKAEVNALLSTPAEQDAEDKKIIEEAKEKIDETEAKEPEEGAVIDIQVIEEKKDNDADVLDIVKAAEEAFVAEVIPDNLEVELTPEEGEEVIEYTLNSADAIPIGAIAVATFAIFLALIFFYN